MSSEGAERVSGPLRLYPKDLQRFEANPDAVIQRVVCDAIVDPQAPEIDIEYRLVGNGVPFADWRLVLMKSDLDAFLNPDESQEKPLLTKERNTLLKIIAALADEAKIDLHHATKSSEALSSLMDKMGIPVSPRAIENHLKAAQSISAKKLKK